MTGNKNHMLNILIFAIVGGIYNVIAFFLIDSHDRVFWISYAFTMIAIVMPIIIQLRLFTTGAYPKKVFLGLPIVIAAFIYLVVQMAAGFALMLLPDGLYKVSVIVQLIVLAVFLVFALSALMVKNNAEAVEAKISEKRFFVSSLVVELQGLADRADDPLQRKKLKALAEAVRFSDPMSHPSLAPQEVKLEALAAELEAAAGKGSADQVMKEFEATLTERNRKAKLLK
ncbi:MAG: hypothetical protein LBG82_00775 [Clostridiales Family XIII bacterium]|jgi:hypothetical protein|nr:hypothetical protein [Clostridiales Family XIII bacterium]